MDGNAKCLCGRCVLRNEECDNGYREWLESYGGGGLYNCIDYYFPPRYQLPDDDERAIAIKRTPDTSQS